MSGRNVIARTRHTDPAPPAIEARRLEENCSLSRLDVASMHGRSCTRPTVVAVAIHSGARSRFARFTDAPSATRSAWRIPRAAALPRRSPQPFHSGDVIS